MTDTAQPLLIKRYASRRLYNTETSDYVTLDDVARVIREGREVKIVDLKTGDDVTRQYLLQIIAEHESRGDHVLPVDVLTDLVRSYTSQAQSIVPHFLASSFAMLRDSQTQMMEGWKALPNPVASAMDNLTELQRKQQEFLSTMLGGFGRAPARPDEPRPSRTGDDLADIRRQLADLQARLAELQKYMAARGAAGGAGRITLWGVELFVAVAEEGAVSAAARRFDASTSAVSQQIANLESALGTPLFDRAARPMALTVAGRLFLRRARRILDEAARARSELSARDLSGLATLRLGAIEDFDAGVTPRLLTGLAGGLTHCHFHLETAASHRLLELLEARALDLAIAAETGPAPDWAEVWPLLTDPFVLVLPAARAGHGTDLRGLRDLPFIHYTARHVMGRLIEAWLARQSLRLPQRFELDSYHAILAMVAAGAGWSIVTPLGYAAAQRFQARVALAPLPGPPMARRICLFARAGQMGGLAGDVAGRAASLIAEEITAPLTARMPFLAGRLGPPDQVP